MLLRNNIKTIDNLADTYHTVMHTFSILQNQNDTVGAIPNVFSVKEMHIIQRGGK
jgi:hypothetical protein